MSNWKSEMVAEKKALEEKVAQLEAEKTEKAPTVVLTKVEEPILEEPKINTDDPIQKAFEMGRKEKATKPWEQRDSSAPWKMDMLKMQKNRPGFHPRWVREDNVEKRMNMGYVVADRKDYQAFQNPISAGTDVTSYMRRGDLILMEIPLEGKKAYMDANEKRLKTLEDDAKQRVQAQAIEVAKELGYTAKDLDIKEEVSVTRE